MMESPSRWRYVDLMTGMPRILIAECKQEVSSFNPVPSSFDDFVCWRGDQMYKYHRRQQSEVGGSLSIFDEAPGLELVPTFGARSISSGGTLAADSWDRLSRELLDAIAGAGPVDAAYFAMHGAMAAANELDPEGFLLQEARQLLGNVPIVVSLDLHGILTDRMLEFADAIVLYHTYPHVDFFETGARAGRLLLRIVRDGARPAVARVKIPALVRGDELITETGLFGECIRRAQQIEATPAGLSAGMLIGNPFTDVPELCSSSLVITDADQEAANGAAIEMANLFWQHHAKMQMPLTGMQDAVECASQTKGTVILMDAADATSSGASGDSNAILRALVEADFTGRCLIPIVDPPAVERAFSTGVGSTMQTPIGGSLDPQRFTPLPMDVRVRMLSDGHFLSESFRQPWYSGETAVLESENIVIVATSRPVSLYDRALFYAHGQDPKRFDLVVVKSPHCESHMFSDWCARLITVDAPGSTSANLLSLGHTRCARPMFPLDDSVAFEPVLTPR
jgi:microcystin degradation protein MlrC